MRVHHSRGFSLLEALISLVVISIGLLGVIALQNTGLNFNNVASMRSIATIEVSSLVDMMRTNICGVMNSGATNPPFQCNPLIDNAFSYANLSSETTLPGGHTTIADPGSGNYCTTAGTVCTSQQQAAADLWNISQIIANDLPAGSCRVTCNDNPCLNTSNYTVLVSWSENDLITGAAVTRNFNTVFIP
ncbi:MAG: prepilin-type N-terminal cleavage/methylation domain-containing protein [Gammaproteobacteria bacterium]|nr:prepilin-type N-terminal cleavage/methylation domain-containing protein [Gammaproteobacteria bacterium]